MIAATDERARSPAAPRRRVALALIASVYAVLWAGGVAHHFLYGGVGAGQNWLASLFLAVAGALVLLGARGARELRLLGGVAALGFAVELVGVRTGLPFGSYAYTDVLEPRLFGVPLVMSAAWMTLVAYVRQALGRAGLPTWAGVVAGAAWMTAIDLLIDPLAANRLGYWRWAGGGVYYGIPALNFAGWFVTSLLAFYLVRRGREPNRWARRAGLSIVLFFTLLAVAHALYLAALVGGGLCLLDLLVGVRRFRGREGRPSRSTAG